MSPLRHHLLVFARTVFVLLVISAVWTILDSGFTNANRTQFISQMNDRHSGGALILGLVMATALWAAGIAVVYERRVAAILRILVALLLWVLVSTTSNSSEHLWAYLGVALLYGTITVFTVMALTSSSVAGTIWAAPLGILTLVAMVSQFMGGPNEQKYALIGLLLIECLTIFVCYPRRLAWFEGVDGT